MTGKLYSLKTIGRLALQKLWDSCRDLLPIVVVISFFQVVVIRQPLPDFTQVIAGSLLVVIGLSLFVQGLEMALFPIGESLAQALARKGSLLWLLLFSFLLGSAIVVAKPIAAAKAYTQA